MVSIKYIKSMADTYNSPEEVAKRKAELSQLQVNCIKEYLLYCAKTYGRCECSTRSAFYSYIDTEDKVLTDKARSILESEGFYVKPASTRGDWLIGISQSKPIDENQVAPVAEVKDTRPTEFSWFRGPSFHFLAGLCILASLVFAIATAMAYIHGNILVFIMNIVYAIFMIVCAAIYVNMKNYWD